MTEGGTVDPAAQRTARVRFDLFTRLRTEISEGAAYPHCPRMCRGIRWFQVPNEAGYLARDFRTGLRMRVGEHERNFCKLINGERTSEEIIACAGASTGSSEDQMAAGRLLRLLTEVGAIEDADRPESLPVARTRRDAFLVVTGVEAVLERLASSLRWYFTVPAQVVVCAGFVAVALMTPTLFNWDALQAVREWPVAAWGVFVLLGVLGVVMHELAHGIALSHVGGKTPRIAFGLTRPLALASVDVASIYGLPSRSAGFKVLLAGSHMDLLLASIAVGGALLVPRGTVHTVAIVLAIQHYANALVALLPVEESDGYQILAYLSDQPGLRRVASQIVAGLRTGASWERRLEQTCRTRVQWGVCVGYIIAKGVWRVSLAGLCVYFLAQLARSVHWAG